MVIIQSIETVSGPERPVPPDARSLVPLVRSCRRARETIPAGGGKLGASGYDQIMLAQPSAADVREYLTQAVALAERNVAAGGGPFGALVVTPDGTVHEGVNRVTRDNDPTAHAEVVAIRTAAAESGNFDLGGAVLYASCEPCPLCLAAALWARIDRVYYAADRHGAAAAGFDDAVFYEYFAGTRPELLPVSHTPVPTSGVPFDAWRNNTERTDY
ncbi:Guanine deaminase [Arthrobacter sp. Bi83]|nr:Guanine deaminase [Arthrobacter sp. Bi83]